MKKGVWIRRWTKTCLLPLDLRASRAPMDFQTTLRQMNSQMGHLRPRSQDDFEQQRRMVLWMVPVSLLPGLEQRFAPLLLHLRH